MSTDIMIDAGVPVFPHKREAFNIWLFKMEAYLDQRGLLEVVRSATPALNDINNSSSVKSSPSSENTPSSQPSAQQQAAAADAMNLKRKSAYNILINSLKDDNHIGLVMGIPRGDAAAVFEKLKGVYGSVRSSSNKSLILKKITSASKGKNEPIEEFVARMENLFRELSAVGTTLAEPMQKHYILSALENVEEWKLPVKLLLSADVDDNMTIDEVMHRLVSEDTRRRIANEMMKTHKDESSSLFVRDNNKNNFKHHHNNNHRNNNNHSQSSSTQVVPASQKKYCYAFISPEGCKRSNCQYEHIRLCRDFLAGSCRFGDKCRFVHSIKKDNNNSNNSNNNSSSSTYGRNNHNKHNNHSRRNNK